MSRRLSITFLCFIFGVLVVAGCSRREPLDPEVSTTPAHQKLINLLETEYKIKAVTKAFENTLWIYIPVEKPFLSIASSREGPQKSDKRNKSIALRYFDGELVENGFEFKYDLGEAVSYEESNGITTEFDDTYQMISQKLMSALTRSYGHIERKVDSHQYIEKLTGDRDFVDEIAEDKRRRMLQSNVITQSKVPDFIVFVIADVEKGIEFKNIAYLQDIRRLYQFQDPGFSEEYVKRVITEQIGHKIIIQDLEGKHLNYRDLTWNEFLLKQIVHRVKFKFTRSSHKPQDTDPGILKDLTLKTLQAYPFRNYEKVLFRNLEDDKTFSFQKSEVPPFREFKPKENDKRYRTITFDPEKKI